MFAVNEVENVDLGQSRKIRGQFVDFGKREVVVVVYSGGACRNPHLVDAPNPTKSTINTTCCVWTSTQKLYQSDILLSGNPNHLMQFKYLSD